MSKFRWGPEFLHINNELLHKYAACTDAKSVIQAQTLHLQMLEEERAAARSRPVELPPSSDSESDSEHEQPQNS